jgi:hypothetical protein
MIPGWYRRACALALTKLTDEGDLNISKLIANLSHPITMIEYLRRVQEVVRNRKFFSCSPQASDDVQEGEFSDVDSLGTTTSSDIVGLGPRDMASSDLVCILFGCSVPVILRPTSKDSDSESVDVTLVGEAYVHDHMEGELFAGMSKDELRRRSSTFRIH